MGVTEPLRRSPSWAICWTRAARRLSKPWRDARLSVASCILAYHIRKDKRPQKEKLLKLTFMSRAQ